MTSTNQSLQRSVLFTAMLLTAGTAFAVNIGTVAPADAAYTTTDTMLLLMYVLLALVVSFMCSVAEAVLLSITPAYIAALKQERPRRAALLERLKQDKVDQSLAAILTLNTIAHTVGAIGSGSKAAVVFGSAWFGVFSAVMTLMILFLSEIIPKTLGAVYWPRLTGLTALFVQSLIIMLYPLIRLSEKLTRLVSGGRPMHTFSRNEFIAMAGLGEKSGHLNESESRIIRNLFRLESLRARDVMTPRTVIVALPAAMSVDQALENPRTLAFSRLPVFGKDLDEIHGFVMKHDLLLAKAEQRGGVQVDSLKREMLAVIAAMPLIDLLEFLLDKRQHTVLVVNEYGGTVGLVTLEDVVETLLGMEIVDETDRVTDMQALARRQWAKRARNLGLETGDDGEEG